NWIADARCYGRGFRSRLGAKSSPSEGHTQVSSESVGRSGLSVRALAKVRGECPGYQAQGFERAYRWFRFGR
ncbi:hypothetical protein BaRGS_00013630, partial [Batillaria attramentaria]